MSSLVEKVLKLKNSNGRAGINQDALINVLVEATDAIENGGGGTSGGMEFIEIPLSAYPIEGFELKVLGRISGDHPGAVIGLVKDNLDYSIPYTIQNKDAGIWYIPTFQMVTGSPEPVGSFEFGDGCFVCSENGSDTVLIYALYGPCLIASWHPANDDDAIYSVHLPDPNNPGKYMIGFWLMTIPILDPSITDDEIIADIISKQGNVTGSLILTED